MAVVLLMEQKLDDVSNVLRLDEIQIMNFVDDGDGGKQSIQRTLKLPALQSAVFEGPRFERVPAHSVETQFHEDVVDAFHHEIHCIFSILI